MFFAHKYIFVIVFIAFSFTLAESATANYRIMSSSQGWKADKDNNSSFEKPFCAAFNVYERDFPLYLSTDQKKTSVIFYLANLISNFEDTHKLKLMFDNQIIIDQDISGLSKPIVKIFLEPSHVDKLYIAEKISLSLGSLGYLYDNSEILSAQSILNTCLQTKRKASQSGEEITAKLDVLEDDLEQENIESSPLPVSSDGKNVKSSKVDAMQDNALIEPASGTSFEDSFNSPNEIYSAIEMEQKTIAHRQKDAMHFENRIAEKAVHDDQEPGQKAPIRMKQSYNDFNANTLSDDEIDLFESMKTKMFLLEQEKQAAKSKLTDLRQKEIEVMKIDIGNKQKISEQAEKIRILQEKLQKYQYRQINDKKPAQETPQKLDQTDINNVVDELTSDAAKEGTF